MQAESTIWTHCDGEKFTIRYTYIDDMMGGFSDIEEAERAKQELRKHYSVKTMEVVDHMLGIKVEKVTESLCDVNTWKIWNAKLQTKIDITTSGNFTVNRLQTEEEQDEMKEVPYHETLGLLMWL